MEGDIKKIIHLTTLHPRFDTRIFIKQIKTLEKSLNYHIELIVADGKGDQKYENKNYSIKDIGIVNGNRILSIIFSSILMLKYIVKTKPILIHFHDPEIIPLALFCKILNIKVIYDVHEDFGCVAFNREWVPFAFRIPLKIFIRIVEYAAARIFDANVVATKSIFMNFPSRNSIIVQNFPIEHELISKNTTDYKNRSLSVSYVGYATFNRGAKEMVQAISELTVLEKFVFEFAGPIDSPALEKELKDLIGWRSVNYHGHVSREKMAEILSNTRAGLVVFHPTANHVNAQPNKIFEYMAAGIPVIASDFPLWRAIIEEAKCGILVNPLSPKSIANAIEFVLKDPSEAEQMGLNGQMAVREIFNWQLEKKKLISLYKELLVDV